MPEEGDAGPQIYRLPAGDAAALIHEEWAPHESRMYREAKMRPGSSPSWRTELLEHPDGGPSDSAYAKSNKNRPSAAVMLDRDPIKDLEIINEALEPSQDDFRAEDRPLYPPNVDPALGGLWRRSEMRTPLIVPASILPEPEANVDRLAADIGVPVVKLQESSATEQEVDRVLESALAEGKWVVIVREQVNTAPHGEMPGWFIFRRAALTCLTVTPDPDRFPKREMFRLWVIVPEAIDLNNSNYPAFPTLFVHQALQLCQTEQGNGGKVVRKMPADPSLLEDEHKHRQVRLAQGRDEDQESLEGDVIDNSCSSRKITGPLFVRSHEMAVYTSPQRERQRLGFAKAL